MLTNPHFAQQYIGGQWVRSTNHGQTIKVFDRCDTLGARAWGIAPAHCTHARPQPCVVAMCRSNTGDVLANVCRGSSADTVAAIPS